MQAEYNSTVVEEAFNDGQAQLIEPKIHWTMAPQVHNGLAFEEVLTGAGNTAAASPVQPAADGDGSIFIAIPTFRGKDKRQFQKSYRRTHHWFPRNLRSTMCPWRIQFCLMPILLSLSHPLFL